MPCSIAVQVDDFNVGDEYNRLVGQDARAGAVVFFVGRVRDLNHDQAVSQLTLEHYPGMTERVLEQLVDTATQRWELFSVRVVHRVGRLSAADQIVFVGVTSKHRESAFQAAEFLMDFLKTRAPFWKREQTNQGERWLDENQKDLDALHRWET